MLGSNPRLKIAGPDDGIRSTENRLHPVASSSSISPAFSTVAPGIFSRPSRNRADASISGFISRGDLYSGPSSRNSTRSMARIARRMTKSREIAGVFGDGGVVPLLTQLGNLRGLTGHHPARVTGPLEDAVLQQLRRPVGVAPGQQRTTFDRVGRPPGTQNTRTGTTDRSSSASSSSTSRPAPRRRVAFGQLEHLDVGVGMLAALALQPVVQQLAFAGDDTDASTSASSVVVKLAIGSAVTFTTSLLGRDLFGRLLGGGVFLAAAFLRPPSWPTPAPSWRAPSSPASSRGAFFAARLLGGGFAARLYAPDLRNLVVRPVLQRVEVELTHLGDAVRQVLHGPVVDGDRRVHRRRRRCRD